MQPSNLWVCLCGIEREFCFEPGTKSETCHRCGEYVSVAPTAVPHLVSATLHNAHAEYLRDRYGPLWQRRN
jgi:hypothetical protein